MTIPFSTTRTVRSGSNRYPLPASSVPGSVTPSNGSSRDEDEDEAATKGWYDSSFDLRRGLEVIEWVLPDFPSPRNA